MDVELGFGLCRHFPDPERCDGEPASVRDDRVPAAAVSVCTQHHRVNDAERRLSAASARSDRLRRPLSAEPGTAATTAGSQPAELQGATRLTLIPKSTKDVSKDEA